MVEYKFYLCGVTRRHGTLVTVEVGGYALDDARESAASWSRLIDRVEVVLATTDVSAARRYRVGDVE